MNFTLTLSIDEVNLILRSLDNGPHREVRPLFDRIISDVAMQQNLARAAEVAKADAEPKDEQ